MPKPAVSVEGLCKAYHRPGGEPLWALKDVFLAVPPGEILGVIGHNGAGKSTLLKLLAGITAPTAGRAVIRGAVASLLEVGTGFHQELTGRENIFLNGALLGMGRREIARKLDAIVDFAGTEALLETPVKFYSTGMALRLAFAVAAHLEADVLLVDEVLAVGDHGFRQKCLEKTRTIAERGRTVLFVSHNLGALGRLCSRSVCLEAGKIVDDGPTAEVIRGYVSRASPRTASVSRERDRTKPMCLLTATIIGPDGNPRAELGYDETIRVRVDYAVHHPVTGGAISVSLGTVDQVPLFVSADHDGNPGLAETRRPGVYRAEVEIPSRWLNTGRYVLIVFAVNGRERLLYDKIEFLTFDVVETGTPGSVSPLGVRQGLLQPWLRWDVREVT